MSDYFHTVATVEEIADYFCNNKKLNKNMSIIQTACHTIFQRRMGLFKAGYCLIVTDRGDTREIEVMAFGTGGFKIMRKNYNGLKTFFELLHAIEASRGEKHGK